VKESEINFFVEITLCLTKNKWGQAVVPLNEYLSKFNELTEILKMRPDEIVKKINKDE
jgi:hypothetical protein